MLNKLELSSPIVTGKPIVKARAKTAGKSKEEREVSVQPQPLRRSTRHAQSGQGSSASVKDIDYTKLSFDELADIPEDVIDHADPVIGPLYQAAVRVKEAKLARDGKNKDENGPGNQDAAADWHRGLGDSDDDDEDRGSEAEESDTEGKKVPAGEL
jgi:hypothetical protein